MLSTAGNKAEEDALEGTPKVVVKDCVNDGVQSRVDVTQPDGWGEYERWDVTLWASLTQLVADADGVDDVDCEEGRPAHEKHTCTRDR